ncbi:MAG TPA: hypothetical protein VHK69_15610 [Chitinophagaceae bacterium]|jgi:hypothetical protein|nr:hypothetical protein [Chitinophagaceae bacterium]
MKPLFKKLNLTHQKEIVVLQAPESFRPELDALDGSVTVYTEPEQVRSTGFVLLFATRQKELDALVPKMAGRLEGDGILWCCYPKKSSRNYTCDFNRDTGWSVLGDLGFEPVRQVAIDADWSALRFRKVQYIKQLTRSKTISNRG